MALETEPHRLLVADDDAELLALIGFALRNGGFDVVTASNGALALVELERRSFGLAVLDINMPGADGFEVCEQIRANSATPVIMLSARNDEADIVRALEIGADDYITKPFSPATLMARVRALLRRVAAPNELAAIEVGGAILDFERRTLRVAEMDFNLTPLEAHVLHMLLTNAGRFVATERLATAAWGRSGPEQRHALKQVVYRLRRKLEDRTQIADLLQATRSAGYRWAIEKAHQLTQHAPR